MVLINDIEVKELLYFSTKTAKSIITNPKCYSHTSKNINMRLESINLLCFIHTYESNKGSLEPSVDREL